MASGISKGRTGKHRVSAESLHALLPNSRPAPLLPVYLTICLILVQVILWGALIIGVFRDTSYPVNGFPESQARAISEFQQYYPLLIVGLGLVFLTGTHIFLLLKYFQGHRWAAIVLSVLQIMGMFCSLITMLLMGVLLSQLNGAPPELVEQLLGSDSPLYLPVYYGLCYLVLSVIVLALLWSRGSRAYTRARSDWRLRYRLQELQEQGELLNMVEGEEKTNPA